MARVDARPVMASGGEPFNTWDALRGVSDPELYLDVVSLKLVYGARERVGALVVEVTTSAAPLRRASQVQPPPPSKTPWEVPALLTPASYGARLGARP